MIFFQRAENRLEQDKWMQAILTALNQSPTASGNRMCHFRYSSDDLTPTHGSIQQVLLSHQEDQFTNCNILLIFLS